MNYKMLAFNGNQKETMQSTQRGSICSVFYSCSWYKIWQYEQVITLKYIIQRL